MDITELLGLPGHRGYQTRGYLCPALRAAFSCCASPWGQPGPTAGGKIKVPKICPCPKR